MTGLVDRLGDLSDPVLLLVVAAFVVAESGLAAGLVLPGEAVLVLAGFLAGTGRLPLAAVIPLAVLTAVAGDHLGYLLGGRTIKRLRATRARSWLGDDRLQRTRDQLAHQPFPLLVASRFVGPVRALLPTVAGATHSPYRKLLDYSVTSAAVWAPTVILAGYFAHDWVQRWGSAAGAVLAAGFVAYLVVGAVRRRRSKGRHPVDCRPGAP